MTATDARNRVIINFHGIGEPSEGVPTAEHQYWCPRNLWLALADCLVETSQDHDVAVEITVDDGNLSDVVDALPALVERGLTASFFVCAGRFRDPRYLSADHLRELRAAGMGIGSHGWAHVDLRRVADSEMYREVTESRARIAEAVGAEISAFAIPFGSYNRRVLRHLRGYDTVFTSDRVRAAPNGWLTPRYSYVHGWTPGDIRTIISTGMSPLRAARRKAAVLYKRWR
ncbi:polysaccharide deacetylase family protein [Microlunatus aurantiacus]|uniref:Polysaccharide deacetylase family protein n=1 Tax=Microlunatus aurantiacus TaxID=446786 RepID=A0ABP7DKE1_9ACTN